MACWRSTWCWTKTGLVPIPEHLSYAEAATLPCAAVTAWHALVTEGGIRAGDYGAGAGHRRRLDFCAAIRAPARGSRRSSLRAATTNSPVRSRWAHPTASITGRRRNGAAAVLELTGGAGVDHVIEVGGAGTLPQSFRAVRFGGRISLIGVLAEPGAAVDPRPLMMKGARLQGIYVGSREMFEAMNRAIALHRAASGDRPRVSVCRSARGVSLHENGGTLRENRDQPGMTAARPTRW